MADGTDYLNGSHDGVRIGVAGMRDWSEQSAYLQGMYQPLAPLEADTQGGPATDAALRAEADFYNRHLDAAGFMLDHAYAVEHTVGDLRKAAITATDLYQGTDADSAASLAAANQAFADSQADTQR